MATKKGIDVSKYQGNINWERVDTDFAIIRAGYGSVSTQVDPMFEKNYQGAKAAGIPVGAYWYAYATTPEQAKAEAKLCLETIKGKQFEYPIYYDIEDKSQIALGKAKLTAIAEAFCETMEAAGYFVGVYSYTNFFQNYINHEYLAKLYTIWLADYRTLYNRSLKRDMHQYTSSGTVTGISGRVDMNTCTRDFPTIIKAAGLNGYKKAATSAKPATKDVVKVGDKVTITGAYAAGKSGKASYTAAVGKKRYVTKIHSGAANPYQLGTVKGVTSGAFTTGFAPAKSIKK